MAVAGAAAILGVVSAATPLFLDAAGGATLQRYVEGTEGPVPSVTIVLSNVVTADIHAYRDDLLARTLLAGRGGADSSEGPSLVGPPVKTGRGDLPVEVSTSSGSAEVRMVSRTGFRDQVERLDEGEDAGVWLADFTASDLGVQAGDEITVRGREVQLKVPVAGIYADLLREPETPYWAPMSQYIYPASGSDTRPPALMLMDLDLYLDLGRRLEDDQEVFSWEFPFDQAPRTIDDRRAIAAGVDRFHSKLLDSSTELGVAFDRVNFHEPLSGWVGQATAVVGSITGPVETISLAGRIVALLVVAGAGTFLVRRRRVEYTLLDARGVSPARLGLAAAAEALIPALVGGAAGLAAGWVLVRALGPEGVIAPDVLRSAAVQVGVSTAAAVALLGVVVAATVRAQSEQSAHRFRRVASKVPWELVVLVLAGASFYEVLTRGAEPLDSAGGPPEIDRLLLLFPILAIAGLAGLATRALVRLLPRLRALGGQRSTALYLATRRLTAASRLATTLVVASTMSVGMLIYAATLSSSIEGTANQEASLIVGSESSVGFSGDVPDLGAASFPVTAVARISGASFTSGDGAEQMDVVAVDPESFAEAAFWEDEFSGTSLEQLMVGLGSAGSDRIPVVIAGPAAAPVDPLLRIASYDIPVRVSGAADPFPGMVGQRPAVIVASDALSAFLEANDTSLPRLADRFELWAKAPEEALVSYARGEGIGVVRSQNATEIRSTPEFLALTWMLTFMQALGILGGIVVLIAALLYLQTRQRQGEAAYALARRMGLSRAAHERSVALEMAGMLLAAFVLGSGLAAITSLLVYGRFVIVGDLGTAPLFRLPLPVLGLTAASLLAFSWAGGRLVQRRADRADVAQVMRLAD